MEDLLRFTVIGKHVYMNHKPDPNEWEVETSAGYSVVAAGTMSMSLEIRVDQKGNEAPCTECASTEIFGYVQVQKGLPDQSRTYTICARCGRLEVRSVGGTNPNCGRATIKPPQNGDM